MDASAALVVKPVTAEMRHVILNAAVVNCNWRGEEAINERMDVNYATHVCSLPLQ